MLFHLEFFLIVFYDVYENCFGLLFVKELLCYIHDLRCTTLYGSSDENLVFILVMIKFSPQGQYMTVIKVTTFCIKSGVSGISYYMEMLTHFHPNLFTIRKDQGYHLVFSIVS